jgi:hypothetical protein
MGSGEILLTPLKDVDTDLRLVSRTPNTGLGAWAQSVSLCVSLFPFSLLAGAPESVCVCVCACVCARAREDECTRAGKSVNVSKTLDLAFSVAKVA